MENISIEEYHKRPQISSSMLKQAIKSEAHIHHFMTNKTKTQPLILGDAVHAYILEPDRFSNMYTEDFEVYKRNFGEYKAGDKKVDKNGYEIACYIHKDDSMSLKGSDYRKFKAIIKAYNESAEAKKLVKSAKYVEQSFFYSEFKARPDFITNDGWIVDIKTVGGTSEKPSSPDKFCRDFFKYGYDLQMYMYFNIVKQEIKDLKGFKFLCFDACEPSGVQIYTFVNGESDWFELGGYRFNDALIKYNKYLVSNVYKVYVNETPDTLPLSFESADALTKYRSE